MSCRACQSIAATFARDPNLMVVARRYPNLRVALCDSCQGRDRVFGDDVSPSVRMPPPPPQPNDNPQAGYVITQVDVNAQTPFSAYGVGYRVTQSNVDLRNQLLGLGGPGGTSPTARPGPKAGGSSKRPQSNPDADAAAAGYVGSTAPSGTGNDTISPDDGGPHSNSDADAAMAGYVPSWGPGAGTESASASQAPVPPPGLSPVPLVSLPPSAFAPLDSGGGSPGGTGTSNSGEQQATDRRWVIALIVGLILLLLVLALKDENQQQSREAVAV